MGFALAEELAERGAEVILVTGPVNLEVLNKNIKRVDVISAKEMYNECIAVFPSCDAAIMCAAVADYTPAMTSENKIKRNKKELMLKLIPNKDIAFELGKTKLNYQILAGFALETDNETQNAFNKLKKKNLDFIVLYSLKHEGSGFGYDTNKISIIDKNGKTENFSLKSKKEVAKDIINKLASFMRKNKK